MKRPDPIVAAIVPLVIVGYATILLAFIGPLGAFPLWHVSDPRPTPSSSPVSLQRSTVLQTPSPRPSESPRAGRSRSPIAVTSLPTGPTLNQWKQLADCESGQRINGVVIPGTAVWSANTGNRYEGGLQLEPGVDSRGRVWRETPAQQIARARVIWSRQGWAAWPDCARRYGWLS